MKGEKLKMNKQLNLTDSVANNIHDLKIFSSGSGMRGVATFRNHETGEIIWKGHNKVILPGAEFLALSVFDLSDAIITPSYNTVLDLENTVYSVPTATNKAFLFCVGTDGCGTENSQVFDVDYRRWIDEDSIVPFQYLLLEKDLTASDRTLYFGRKEVDSKFYAYYFKAFNSAPVLNRQWSNGDPIDATVYTMAKSNTTTIETFVTLEFSITKDDCRDFFIATTGINDARVNCLSICTAWPKTIDGYTYYQDIRPITRLNFPNEPLIDLRKGIDVTYQIYF